ncbi:hypothetical protein [Spirosoma flavum]|uniref:Helix-turn-helix domain-containing protein n=1 Tax=Spirosoma flavum TaxID=2048557 RepID=A0ABW6AQT0_9BACT
MKKLFIKIKNFTVVYFTRNYLDRTEASYYTGISEAFLIKLSGSKVIKSISGENALYRRSDLDAWIKEYGVINPMFRKSLS